MHDVAIRVRGLRMAYGPVQVLNGVDLDLRRGEVFTLLGPNGAGKTTLVEILEGFRTGWSGEVEVLGENPARAGDAWRARLGVVVQSWRDHPRWRVRDLVAHVAAHYDEPHDVDELLAALGLTEAARNRAGVLSGAVVRRTGGDRPRRREPRAAAGRHGVRHGGEPGLPLRHRVPRGRRAGAGAGGPVARRARLRRGRPVGRDDRRRHRGAGHRGGRV
ncbi:ATP-binding cassette domain-containing protein, partial [Microbispora rosea]